MTNIDPPDRIGRVEPSRSPPEGGPANEQPTFLSMVGLVALVVALVILVFFGIGYLFGRVFL